MEKKTWCYLSINNCCSTECISSAVWMLSFLVIVCDLNVTSVKKKIQQWPNIAVSTPIIIEIIIMYFYLKIKIAETKIVIKTVATLLHCRLYSSSSGEEETERTDYKNRYNCWVMKC